MGPGVAQNRYFSNGKNKWLGQVPQQHFEAISKHVDFGGRPPGSLGDPRLIQVDFDFEKLKFCLVGFGFILIGLGRSD